MRGRISSIKKWKHPYFFITDDAGVEYFTHPRFLTDKKDYDKYAWPGNTAEFDIQYEENGERPVAINVQLTPEYDPDAEEKALRKRLREIEDEKNRKIKEEKKARGREIARRNELRHQHKMSHEYYAVFKMNHNRNWVPTEYKSKTFREGQILLSGLKECHPNSRFNLRHILLYVVQDKEVYREYDTNKLIFERSIV